MTKKIITSLLLLLCISFYGFGQKIFLVDSLHKADITVYKSTDTTLADVDLLVYRTSNQKEVTRDGIWYFVSDPRQADIKVYLTGTPANANLVVYYVPFAMSAGWLKKQNRHYLKKHDKNH